MIIDPDMRVCYVSALARPGGHWNDPKLWKLCIPDVVKVFFSLQN